MGGIDMELLVVMLLTFAIVLPLVFGMTIPILKDHKSATAGVVNHDSVMRKFIYKINLSRDEIISLLTMTNDADELSCTFDLNKAIIRFSEYGSHRDYYFQIQEYNGYSILQLEQVEGIGMQSFVPYKLNPFMVSKLYAEMLPFPQNSL